MRARNDEKFSGCKGTTMVADGVEENKRHPRVRLIQLSQIYCRSARNRLAKGRRKMSMRLQPPICDSGVLKNVDFVFRLVAVDGTLPRRYMGVPRDANRSASNVAETTGNQEGRICYLCGPMRL